MSKIFQKNDKKENNLNLKEIENDKILRGFVLIFVLNCLSPKNRF